ncbi:MAG: GNAT family N-acetyltransferase [Acidimicrobiales bacterium]
MAAHRRLTVSLVVTGDVGREIDGMRRALGAAALERIPPHITLVPPVNVREDNLDQAATVVREAAQRSRPMRLELEPPATFWPATPVVYLPVSGDTGELSELNDLRTALLAGPLATPSGRRQEREYVPHVTLDQSIDPQRIDAVLQALSAYRAAVTIEQVTLLEFQETHRRWHTLSSPTLGRPRVVGRGGFEVELAVSSLLDPAAESFQQQEWAGYTRTAYGDDSRDEPFAITARIGGEIAGTATGQLRSDYCRLANLIVAAPWRSHGVGSHLLAAVEQLAREHRTAVVRLETRTGGRAEQFYLRHGYEEVVLLPRWRRGHDFAVLERAIG